MTTTLVLVALAVPTQAAADCALLGLVPKVLSAPDVALAADGGIVVGAVSEDRGPVDDGDAAVQPAWTFVVPMGTITPAIESLAPGLAVYKTSADAFELRSGDGATLAKATRSDGDKRPKLAVPKVTSIKYDAPMSRRSIVRVEVKVEGGAPPGAIALVLADAKGKARSWGPATGGMFYPYLQRDCLTLPNGTVPSRKGERVTLFWVDASGRKSAFTKPMTIQ